MLEIIELKSRKLSDLQEIAKELKVPKFRSLKKLDLIYQILDYQAANPEKMKEILNEGQWEKYEKYLEERRARWQQRRPGGRR